MKNDRSNPFRIDVAPELLSELRERLKNTRWSYRVGGTNWDAGTDLNYLRELVAYWLDGYDWRRTRHLHCLAPGCFQYWAQTVSRGQVGDD